MKPLDKPLLLEIYKKMVSVRTFEETAADLFLKGQIPGFLRVYVGEEAVAAGVMAHLTDRDYISSTHRGHGHAVAKGARLDMMMAELHGKKTGYCHGKGGYMHIPVIMLTAESGKDNVVNIVKKGIKDYMVKPFKGEDLLERVGKIMSLEPRTGEESSASEKKAIKYFTQIDDIVVLALPAKGTRPVTVEVEGRLQSKVKEMAAAQLKKMVLDMGGVSETNVSLIRLIIIVFQHCQKANIAVKLVASPKQGEELKGFQETSQIMVANSIEEAKAAL